MATIRDVSKLSGVSIATISRFLSQDPSFSISSDTKEKILQAIDTLDYQYKPRSKSNKINTIGCIMSISFDYYYDPFFKTILNVIESNIHQYKFDSLITLNYTEVLNHNAFIDNVLNQLNGLIIMEKLPDDVMAYLKSKVEYIVSIDTTFPNIPSVGYALLEANQNALNHLVDCGYKNIAYIGGSSPHEPMNASIRMMVYRETMRKHQLPYNEDYIVDCEWNIDICAKETRRLLQHHPEIDAIFAGSDTLANAILGVLYDMDIVCPRDIGIMGFNDNPSSQLSIPPLTTTFIPARDIGLLTLKVLAESIQSKSLACISYKLPTKLVVRQSTKTKE